MKATTCFLAVAAAASFELKYEPTPAGYVLSHCIHEVENGAHTVEQEDGSLLVTSHLGESTIPKCQTR
jgi:hypothetical protein